jgi:hypothetical protein
MSNYTKILEDCVSIANSRQALYGEATQNLKETSDLLKTIFNVEIKPIDIAKVMVCLKLTREKTKPKADNLIDAVNYMAMIVNMTKYE